MAEQSTVTLSGLPTDGTNVDASDVVTPFQQFVTDYNKQVPLSKISADSAWTAWSPTLYKDDSTTALAGTVDFASYIKMGRKVSAKIKLSSVADPSGTRIYFSLPINASVGSFDIGAGAGYVAYAGSTNIGYIEIISATKAAAVKFDRSAWAATATNGVNIEFEYESAS